MKVNWSPLALEKLANAAEFIALDNPSAAEQWANDLFDKTELLSDQPQMGRIVPELQRANCRELIFGNYRIIYTIGNDIQITTIRNVRQSFTGNDL